MRRPVRGAAATLKAVAHPAAPDRTAIVVSSFDGMDDVWPGFWALFDHYWPDCPYDRYMIANRKICRHPRVKTICVGEDRGWGRNLRLGLELIPHEHVLYLQEDYFFCAPVDTGRMRACLP